MATNDPHNYEKLIGKTFTGKYIGQVPKDDETWAVFEVSQLGNIDILMAIEQIKLSVKKQELTNQVKMKFNSNYFVYWCIRFLGECALNFFFLCIRH